MARLPMFQGISIPEGIKAGMMTNVVWLKDNLSELDFSSMLAELQSLLADLIIPEAEPSIWPELIDATTNASGTKIYLTFADDIDGYLLSPLNFAISTSDYSVVFSPEMVDYWEETSHAILTLWIPEIYKIHVGVDVSIDLLEHTTVANVVEAI